MRYGTIASELSRIDAEQRTMQAAVARPRKVARGSAERTLDRALSVSGSLMLLGLILFGPIALVPLALSVVIALVAAAPRAARGGGRVTRNGSRARPDDVEDPWWPWRVVEPDEAYLRRRAA